MSDLADSLLVLNRSIAKAEAIHLERRVLALQTLYPAQGFATEHVAESVTILSPPKFGRKFNHTHGFASYGQVTVDDLRAIEAAYERNCTRPEMDMCDFADKTGFDLLADQYTITGSLCEYQQSLSDFEFPGTLENNIKISILGLEDHETFIKTSNDGFRDNGRPPELLRVLAASAAARPDTILFSASIDGELVGTAGMAVIDTEDKKIVVLYIDSCLPSARGKGVHKALLLERLRIARDREFKIACATAREGSISAKNMEKVGFKKAYSCDIHTKDLWDQGAAKAPGK
jgi:GNAT superfamily N-acetyltransferase